MAGAGDGTFNLVAPGANHTIDFNAYDADVRYALDPYGATRYDDLPAWRTATSHDASSTEAANGACTLVDPPTALNDLTFDARVSPGPCRSAGQGGLELGAFGLTACVGHLCPSP